MLKFLRKCQQSSGVRSLSATVAVVGAATLAGCSADISRFDLGNPEGARAHSGYAPSPSAGMSSRSTSSEFGTAGYDRPASHNRDVARSDLPPPDGQFTTSALSPQHSGSYGSRGAGYGQQAAPRHPSQGYGGNSNNYSSPSYGDASAVEPVADYASGDAGGTIEVRPGDTLYGLSRRHGVSVNALMSANGLRSSNLRVGQRLTLPSGAGGGAVAHEAPRVAALAQQQSSAHAPSDWTNSYTVQPGDSLYAIARQNGISLADLERHNGISDSRRVMPGTVLRLPGGNSADEPMQVAEAPPAYEPPSASHVPPVHQPSRTIETRPVQTEEHRLTPMSQQQRSAEARNPTGTVRLGDQRASTAQQPTILNGRDLNGAGNTPSAQPEPPPQRVAAVETPGSASDAVSPAAAQASGSVAGSSKLRWPVVGKVVGGFGPRPDGTHNDGVNLAAPMGTDVHAAESGVVAYAGDELKGYGNLVLVRHDNGWVTAYAHADEILVKRGDRIRRGQVIAKVGRTGQVDQPQLHFELRQGQKPVDPSPFMESL